jgi:hypothetical protein
VKKRRLCFLLSLILIVLLSSCGYTRPPNQPDFVPIRPDPTSTTQAIASALPGKSTPVISDQVQLSNFTHSSDRFSISYPENWQFFERPNGVVFIDSGDQAGYGVFFSDVGQIYSEQELNQYLVTFVSKNFVDKDADFAPISQEQKVDGSIVAQFSSVDPNLGQAMNEVRVTQKETIVFVLYLSATAEQWQVSQNQLHRLADTFTIINTTPVASAQPPLGTAPPTDEPPEWVLTGPTKSQFGFFYPNDWKVLRQDEVSVAVGMPDSDLILEASVSDSPKAKDNAEAAKKAAQKYVDSLSQDYQDVQTRPVEEFQLDQITDGATIDFLYTAADGTPKAGSIITAASEDKLYQVVFSSSAEVYQAALQWFNPMYKSFKILPVEEIILEDKDQ